MFVEETYAYFLAKQKLFGNLYEYYENHKAFKHIILL